MRISETDCGRIGKRNLPLGQSFDLLGKAQQGLQDRAGLHLDRMDQQLAGHVARRGLASGNCPPCRLIENCPVVRVTSASTGVMNFSTRPAC